MEWVYKSDIFGFHFVNSAGNFKHITKSCKKEYCLFMGDAMGDFNWEAFVKLKYPEEEYYWQFNFFVILIHAIDIKLLEINPLITISWQECTWPILITRITTVTPTFISSFFNVQLWMHHPQSQRLDVQKILQEQHAIWVQQWILCTEILLSNVGRDISLKCINIWLIVNHRKSWMDFHEHQMLIQMLLNWFHHCLQKVYKLPLPNHAMDLFCKNLDEHDNKWFLCCTHYIFWWLICQTNLNWCHSYPCRTNVTQYHAPC